MTLRDREDPAGAAERHRRALLRSEERLEEAADEAIRSFLRQVQRSITPRALTAAISDLFPRATELFTLGQAARWWEEAVAENIAAEVAAVWRTGYFDTRDGTLVRSSQDAVSGYLANVRDRLSRTATPTLPEAAFDKARVALAAETARGSSTRELSRRLAAEFGWDEDATFWRGRKEQATRSISDILDELGPPGTEAREQARLNDPVVRELQRESAEATRHIDRVQSEWQTRAERIARTESCGAYNAGAIDAGRVEGAGVKVWLATGDDRTRESHLEASNACAALDDYFNVGGASLQMPGDPSAPPGETVNCRCTVVFADSCEEAEEIYPVIDPERAREQALAEDRIRTLGDTAQEPRTAESFRMGPVSTYRSSGRVTSTVTSEEPRYATPPHRRHLR